MSGAAPWCNPPSAPGLADGQTDVWRIDLDAPPASFEAQWQLLALDERERANRLRFPRGRERYMAGRAALRGILAAYLRLSPAKIRFAYGSQGKPGLAEPASDVQFSVSHSEGLGICAVTRRARIGADVERVREGVDLDHLAERFFSIRESLALRTLPPDRRPRAFYDVWTRKEAYLKATGHGLSFPLDQFSVSVAPEDPPTLVEVHATPEEPARWALYALPLDPDYAGALAVERPASTLRCWIWNG